MKKLPFKKKILFSTISLFAILILFELILRAAGFCFLLRQQIYNKAESKDPSNIVILCIGESTTAGGKDSYPYQLEEILNAGSSGKTFKVINKGIPAKTTGDILLMLPDFLKEYQPDYVLAMIGINDVIYDRMVTDTFLRRLRWQVLERLRVYKVLKWGAVNIKMQLHDRCETKKSPQPPQKTTEPSKQSVKDSVSINTEIPLVTAKTGTTGSPAGEPQLSQTKPDETPKNPPDEFIIAQKTKLKNAYAVFNNKQEFDRWIKRIRLEEYHPLSQRNLNDIVNVVKKHGAQIIFIQYPYRRINALKKILWDKSLLIIENYDNFESDLDRYGYDKMFEDNFGYDMGHMTRYGNKVLAENVAGHLREMH